MADSITLPTFGHLRHVASDSAEQWFYQFGQGWSLPRHRLTSRLSHKILWEWTETQKFRPALPGFCVASAGLGVKRR